jgi:hypothetical protein
MRNLIGLIFIMIVALSIPCDDPGKQVKELPVATIDTIKLKK